VRRKPQLSLKEARARNRVVRTAIGRILAAQYDLAEPLTERLENLLTKIRTKPVQSTTVTMAR
jgi:hypothetical protein